MKKLTVHGTRPDGHPFPVISYGIRLIEWSDISHVVLDLGEKVYHAHFNNVRFEDKEEYFKTNKIVHTYELEITEEQYEQMTDWCIGYAGQKKGYFKKLFGVLIPHLMRAFFGAYQKNFLVQGMEENAICSELLRFIAIRFWSYKVPCVPHPECFTTSDMMRLLEDNGAKKIK